MPSVSVAVNDFKGLHAYQRARHLAAQVYAAVAEWRYIDQRTLGFPDHSLLGLGRGEHRRGDRPLAQRRSAEAAADCTRLAQRDRALDLVAQERGLMDSRAHEPIAELARMLNGLIRKRL